IHPPRGRPRDSLVAALAVAVVVGASIVMEQSASELGSRHGVPEIVVGALVLAAVTSLPNAVSAGYVAARGRGAATLSIATERNGTNVVAGLLIPALFVGLGDSSGKTTFVALWYVGFTAIALGGAYVSRGLTRGLGAVVVCIYLVFAALVVATGY